MRRAAAAILLALTLALAASPGAAAQDATRAREAARAILAQDRFQRSTPPRPFRDPLRRIGDAARDAFGWLARRLPGGSRTAWIVVGGIVLLVAVVAAAWLGRRQGARRARVDRAAAAPREHAAALRRRATEAERAGDLDTALRLHFRAGLLELDEAGIVRVRAGMRNGDILRAVPSATLADVARRVERVAYGGRPATREDLDRANAAWPRVREEARAA